MTGARHHNRRKRLERTGKWPWQIQRKAGARTTGLGYATFSTPRGRHVFPDVVCRGSGVVCPDVGPFGLFCGLQDPNRDKRGKHALSLISGVWGAFLEVW